MKRPTLLTVLMLAIIVVSIAVISAAQYFATYKIPTNGYINTVGCNIYWNVNMTENCTNIDWNEISPDENKTVVVFIHNFGNHDGILSFNLTNWNPENASQFLSVTSNLTDFTIPARAILPFDITLHVAANTTGIEEFSFTITVTNTELRL